jgi:hypothetical protein
LSIRHNTAGAKRGQKSRIKYAHLLRSGLEPEEEKRRRIRKSMFSEDPAKTKCKFDSFSRNSKNYEACFHDDLKPIKIMESTSLLNKQTNK